MRIIFAGTTEFGIPTLEKLKKNYELVLIITQPDKPSGRKQVLAPPPIKVWAEKNNVPTLQPSKISEIGEQFTDKKPDLFLVAAYGQIIPTSILHIPRFKSINIHGSLLPKYRGATPIQNAILNGDKETGITLIQMDEKMDHGPIIAKEKLVIEENDDYALLYKKMSVLASDLVAKTLPDWFANKIKPAPQVDSIATYTKLLTRADGKINWTNPAKSIDQQIRGLNPEPGTWTTLDGKTIKILSAKAVSEAKIELPGKIYIRE